MNVFLVFVEYKEIVFIEKFVRNGLMFYILIIFPLYFQFIVFSVRCRTHPEKQL